MMVGCHGCVERNRGLVGTSSEGEKVEDAGIKYHALTENNCDITFHVEDRRAFCNA